MLRAQRRSNTYQFYSLWFDPTGVEPTIYRIRGEHTNHYDNNAVAYNLMIKVNEMLPYMTPYKMLLDVSVSY
jgi:hypothetical protein